MIIGQAAKTIGLPPKTIRYYETIGLVKADRAGNNYRQYGDEHLYKLGVVRRARSLGFSVSECRDLLALFDDRSRDKAELKHRGQVWLVDIDRKIEELQEIRAAVAGRIEGCSSDGRPYGAVWNDFTSGIAERH